MKRWTVELSSLFLLVLCGSFSDCVAQNRNTDMPISSSAPSTISASGMTFFTILKAGSKRSSRPWVIEMKDSTFRVFGDCRYSELSAYRVYNSHFNHSGSEIDSSFLPDSAQTFNCVVNTVDNGYAVMAKSLLAGRLVYKYSAENALEWISPSQPYARGSGFSSIVQNPDGGFVGGWYNSQSGQTMIMLIRLSRNGEKIWSREIPKIGRIGPQMPALGRSPSSEYYLGGFFDTTNLHPGYDGRLAYIIKTDSNGQQLWRKTYIGNFLSNQSIWDLLVLEDGSLMACGQGNGLPRSDPAYHDGEDACLWKISPDGDVIWQRNFGYAKPGAGVITHDYDEFYSIDRTHDGGFILAGQLRSGLVTDDSTLSAYLVKVDSNGMQQWWRSYHFETTDRFWHVKSTSDGGYILVGEAIWNNFASRYLYLMKTDSLGFCDGVTSVSSPKPVSLSLDTPYPHPLGVQSSGTVRYTLAQAASMRLSLHDALGRESRVLASGFTEAGEHVVSFESGGLAPGLYLLRMLAGGQAVQKAVIVTR